MGAFEAALADDFNTPKALAQAFDLVSAANQTSISGARSTLVKMLGLIGLDSLAETNDRPDDEAEALLAERQEARAAKEFERADEIRDRLAALGWEVRDGAEGAKLVPKA